MATTHTAFGKFLNHYRNVVREGLLPTTPVIMSEGDSWFSTPLYYNLVDWLEIGASSALFLRMESNGAEAVDMFVGRSLRKINRRLEDIEFDLLLISAGGNDFVDDFLKDAFLNQQPMTPEAALQTVVATGRYNQVLQAYRTMLKAAFAARPGLQVVTHTYDYPRLMGAKGKLTVEQLGLAALFKRSVGDWIARHVRHVLPSEAEQRSFAKLMMDEFSTRVLAELKREFGNAVQIVEFRGQLTQDSDWNDEMHPTQAAFQKLSTKLHSVVKSALPAAKRAGIG